jgi:hypothetical protein
MTVKATDVFAFLSRNENYSIERTEFVDDRFNVIRRSLRLIAIELQDGGDPEGVAMSLAVRGHLMELLTAPVQFESGLAPIFDLLGDVKTAAGRWGTSIGGWHRDAVSAATTLSGEENPMRIYLRNAIRSFALEFDLRIYCHRSARKHFESLFTAEEIAVLFRTETFLHTARDYRESQLFDVLIKAGPLRSRGWGCVPDAIITAPRFETLLNPVWSGCIDEEGFGYDPAGQATSIPETAQLQTGSKPNALGWRKLTYVAPSASAPATVKEVPVDEFTLFKELDRDRAHTLRSAVMVQIDDDAGILYPPQSDVISFDLSADEMHLALRRPGESLRSGMFLILPHVESVEFGSSTTKEGHYSSVWKQQLAEKTTLDGAGFANQLRSAGISLVHLRSCIQHWCRPSTTVIHAPQQRRHFEILIKALGLNSVEVRPNGQRREWWQSAWNEIARARGVAIQTGMEGHDIIEESVLEILEGMLLDITQLAQEGESFELSIPPDRALSGSIGFYRIVSIEGGFRAPDTSIKTILTINACDQWRA